MRKNRRPGSDSVWNSRPIVEGLEDRRLLSASLGHAISSVLGDIFPGLGTPAGGDFHFGHNKYLVGTVVSTDTTAGTITITNPVSGSSSPTTYTLASNATITANGATTTLGSLLAGAPVALQLSTANSTTTVTSISAISQHVAGVVSSVDTTADTITLTGFDGGTTTYPVSTTATITLDGSTSTLGGLTGGESVQLTLSALDGKTADDISARSANPSDGHHGASSHVTTTVVSVDSTADTITVSTTQNGSTTQTTYTVDPSATITANGTATPLASLMAGARVQLTVSSTSSTTVTAIAAISQFVSGTVSSVDTTGNTITLTDHGTATTYTLGTGATITINGSTGTLAGIATGSEAQLTLSALDGKTVTAISDHNLQAIFHHFIPINATVVSVNTTADTITVSTSDHGTATQTTYTVDPSATITADGANTPLSSLSAGANVLLRLSSTSATTVTSIAAESQLVTGTVTSFDATADTITITDHSGTATTYPVSSTATININGATGMLSGISDGSRVVLKLSALDGKTVTGLWAGTPNLVNRNNPISEQLFATVMSVDATANTITVSVTKNGATMQVTYTLATGATVTANGSATMLGSLLAGAQVVLALSTGSSTTVTSVKAISQSVAGTVGSVDATAGTITITEQGGTSKTYTVGTNATITLNGATSTLGALVAGTRVHLQLSALDGSTVTSIGAITPATIVRHHRAIGTVTAVDTTADTITISNPFAGSGTTTTYTLGASATITANGTTATLASLSAGARVVLQITTIGTTTTVTSIAALAQNASGVVSSVDTTANTITITTHGGTTQTYTLGTGATVTLHGAANTLASLTAGLHVQLKLSALDGKTVLSIRAH